MNFHSLKIEEIFDLLETSPSGLNKNEADKRLLKYGKNLLPEEKKKSLILIFLKQFKNIFNTVLIFVLFLSLYLQKFSDAIVVLIIILVNAFIGFLFELRTEKTLEKLKNLLKPKAKVLREGEVLEIDSENLVPGDVVFIEEGDVVLADLRIFEDDNLKIDESILTGESLPVEKETEILPEDTPIQERKNIAYMGTSVVEGKGRGVVFVTGLNTYLGSIYKKYKEEKEYAPHFEKLSKDLIFKMFSIALLTSILIFYFAFQRNYLWSDTLLFVLSSFVSSIPEGLPVIISVLLVVSAYSLFKKNVFVKNMQATENLSVVNLLLTDKTGTLTEDKMVVKKIFVFDEEIEVDNEFLKEKKPINPFDNFSLMKILNACALLSEAEIIKKENEIEAKGNPRDVAILMLLEKAKIKKEEILKNYKILRKEPFSRTRKHKRIVVQGEVVESFYIGAFENLIEKSDFILGREGIKKFENKEEILNKGLEYAEDGFSVLGVAYSEGEKEENIIFVGLIALYDPPKEGVKETIRKLKNAGIDIRILTGDHKATAVYIAKEIGFENLKAVDEKEIFNLSDKELLEVLKDTYIFARVTPETKLKILGAYQKLDYSVAYIGDGVNDVLALKKAEVGVGMGKRGSEVAKSASDLILIDDDLKSLTTAFSEGRKIFNNLKRVVFFLITTNVAESLTLLTSLILGYPLILKPTHILFLNFVTDTLVGTTLAFEKEHGYEMKNPPRKARESLINLDLIPNLIMMVFLMMILTILIFSSTYNLNLEKARTYAFLVMSFTQLYNALNLRSLNQSIFNLNFKLNPYLIFGLIISLFLQYIVIFNETLRNILGFSKITLFEFIIILILSSIVLIAGEILKLIKK